MSDPILVLGATGTQGGAIAGALLARDIPVVALVRDPSSPRAQAAARAGMELVRGDLEDVASLAAAMEGVGAAYAVTTPFGAGAEAEVRQGMAVVQAAEQAGLPWLVLASVASAGRAPVPHFQSKARIEERLRESPVPWTVVAPSYFYENILGAREAIAAGVLPMAIPAGKPLHQVALENLGAVVAAIIGRRDEHIGVRVEVAGDAPTPAEMAAAFGVRHEPVALEDVFARSEDMGAMYTFLSGPGYGIDVQALRARYPEVDWIDFADWARAAFA